MIRWSPVATFARQHQKHINTIKRWAQSGFLFTIGDFYVMKDPKGRWFIGSRAN